MRFLISIIFFLPLFLGANVLNTLGIDIYLFFYLILALSAMTWVLMVTQKKYVYGRRKWEYMIIILIVGMLFYRLMSGMLLDSIRAAAVLFATPFIYLLVPAGVEAKADYFIKRRLMRFLLVLFLVECLLAIFEYTFKARIFLWIDTTFRSHLMGLQYGESFRSIALHGSPLTNALIVTILNAFFITAPIKSKYKILFWGLCALAVLAFNARMAAIINGALLVIYLLGLLASRNFSAVSKLQVYFFSALFAGFALFLVFNYGFGDRLFKYELLDKGSGQVRLDVFSVFDYIDVTQLLKGHSMKDFEAIQDKAGLLIIENFWICQIILYGLIFLILLVLFYGKLMGPYLRRYGAKNGTIVCASFLLLASTNNSLFTQYLPLLLFLTCLNLFEPGTVQLLLPRKMLEVRELYK